MVRMVNTLVVAEISQILFRHHDGILEIDVRLRVLVQDDHGIPNQLIVYIDKLILFVGQVGAVVSVPGKKEKRL